MNLSALRIFGSIFLIGIFIAFWHISGYGVHFSSMELSPQLHKQTSTIQNTASMDAIIFNNESEANSFTPGILEISSIGLGILETSFIGRGNPRLIYADFKWISPYQDRLEIKVHGF